MTHVTPYGTWKSPIAASDLAATERPVQSGCWVGEEFWWSELAPSEQGRYVIRRRQADGHEHEVLPAPWNARSRVHEYGGGAWCVTEDRALVFVELSDQRLWRLDPGTKQPRPLTPAPDVAVGLRYGELTLQQAGAVWCVREAHDAEGNLRRDLVAVPLNGSAAEDPAAVRSIVSGSQFLAAARLSPNGRRLAWIAWDHPQMPWDGTELRVADLGADGTCGPHRTLAGSATEAVLQPEWASDDSLYAVSDRSGWWNLYQIGLDGGTQPLCERSADFAGPLWQLGMTSYAILPNGQIAVIRMLGSGVLGVLNPTTGDLADLDLGDLTTLRLVGQDGFRLLLNAGGAQTPTGLRSVDTTTGNVEVLQLSNATPPDAAYLPEARAMVFPGPDGRDVHAFVYPPRNPGFEGPAEELPPYVARVHGGPTSHTSPHIDLGFAFLTSRGIGVVDINYGGSSGYGREYRERLRGQWGIVDVEDTVAVVRGLAGSGLADSARLGIEGGSAGGWTVLSALTTTDVFACGVSYFGVAELVRFAEDTHDFESRYLDGLIGALPEARELYDSRAPLNNIDGLSCPVLLLQGLDDEIVPPSQAEMFRDALVETGIPHAYRPYEGESHGFRKAETITDAHEASLSFYGQVFGFEPPDVPRLELWRPGA